MKDFKHFGLKRRIFKSCNYDAIWHNLFTLRLGEGIASELPCDESEFYDVGINTKCNAECSFCYVSASGKGVNYPNICETWRKWMDTFFTKVVEDKVTYTNKPFQIAIGSTGEPTIHPEFCEFLETVYNTGVVPNYTTNSITLSDLDSDLCKKILEYTRNYVGGVAVSFGNELLRDRARKAIENLLKYGDTNVNIHHIISDKASVDRFIEEYERYGEDIKYHVLLPLMPSGRSSEGLTPGTFEYLEEKVSNIKNVAFGAHFIKYLRNSKLPVSLYDEQSFSKNIILTPNKVQITPSSFNLECMKVINL